MNNGDTTGAAACSHVAEIDRLNKKVKFLYSENAALREKAKRLKQAEAEAKHWEEQAKLMLSYTENNTLSGIAV